MGIAEELFNGVTVVRIKDSEGNYNAFKVDEVAGVGMSKKDNMVGIVLRSGVIFSVPCKDEESMLHVYQKVESVIRKNDRMVTAYQSRSKEKPSE